MSKTPEIVFLFDVDNTLIDNDRVQAHLRQHLEQTYGDATRDRSWEIFEQLRSELGYADYLGALERYRMEELHRPELLRMSNWLVDYPFAERLYPHALDAVKHVQQWGPSSSSPTAMPFSSRARWNDPVCGTYSTTASSFTSTRSRSSTMWGVSIPPTTMS